MIGTDEDSPKLVRNRNFRCSFSESNNVQYRAKQSKIMNVPGRVFSTLRHKLWDSNALVTGKAVWARDSLASVYMEGKQWTGVAAGAAVDNTLAVYRFARDSSTTMELPRPLVPVRDHVLLPTFRGVERTVEFVTSEKMWEVYNGAKQNVRGLPLGIGDAIILPGIETLEHIARVCLVLVQAPLPSAERVAGSAEYCLDRGKRGIIRAARETQLYFNLIDVQITRMLTRAQWDMLGYGPYAELPADRREEVCTRVCERYLGMSESDSFRRYEFLALIRWNNHALHRDLVDSGILSTRVQAVKLAAKDDRFSEDEWLNASAPWRHLQWHYHSGIILDDIDESKVTWYRRKGTPQCPGPWLPFRSDFHANECLRLEHKYRTFMYKGAVHSELVEKAIKQSKIDFSSQDSEERNGDTGKSNFNANESNLKSWRYQVVQDVTAKISTYNYSDAPHEVLVEQGRQVVCLDDMFMRPVFWAYSGKGDPVRRAVWVQETGSKHIESDGYVSMEYMPYPLEASAILEDAYQYLKWRLSEENDDACKEKVHPERPSVMLTVQVLDQLVQFRGLTDIMSVQRTLGGAISILGRRGVRRGVPTRNTYPKRSSNIAAKVVLPPETMDLNEDIPPEICTRGRRTKCSDTEYIGSLSSTGMNFSEDLASISSMNESTSNLDSRSPSTLKLNQDVASKLFSSDSCSSSALKLSESDSFLMNKDTNSTQHVDARNTSDYVEENDEVHVQVDVKSLVDTTSTSVSKLHEPTDADLYEHVSHLVLVVHGIGDALSTVDLGVVQLRSLVDCCDSMRAQHAEIVQTSPLLQALKRDSNDSCKEGRVEYLPVEWHSRFKSKLFGQDEVSGRGSNRDNREQKVGIWDITLTRAAALRAYTNDTVLDILYFMSPEYHQIIVEEVTEELNRVLDVFKRTTPSFSGKVSIAAHSLGAIICFDILANQKKEPASTCQSDSLAYYAGSTCFPTLDAPIDNLFCLGSPIGMFLMIRGQHMSLGKDFKLPGAKRLFNVFHPFDPVAFRLEPLLCGSGVPRDPEILPTWQGGLRVHYQMRRWWHVVLGKIWRAKRRIESAIEEKLEDIGLIAEFNSTEVSPSVHDEESMWICQNNLLHDELESIRMTDLVHDRSTAAPRTGSGSIHPYPFAVGLQLEESSMYSLEENDESLPGPDFELNGMLAGGYRVDYSLQEKEIEVTNEYIFALGAHLIYWTSKDLCLFMAKQIMFHEQ